MSYCIEPHQEEKFNPPGRPIFSAPRENQYGARPAAACVMLGVLMARNLLIVWLINALALLALPYLVPSVQVDSIYTALVAAALLGLVNTLIRPLIVLLTLPATVLTLGLFIFVINGLRFWFVASFVKGFSVVGFRSAFFAAIVSSVVSWAQRSLVAGPCRVAI